MAQLQSGFHYRIKRRLAINYIFKDTTVSGGDSAITITNYLEDITPATATTVTTTTGPAGATKTITIIKRPPIEICPTNNGLKAGLKQDDSGRVVIDFWGITSDPVECQTANYINSTNKTGLFYYRIHDRVHLSDVTSYIQVSYTTWEVGIASIPFKYRFGYKKDTVQVPNDASLNVSAGVYFGKKWGYSTYYIDKTKSTNTKSLSLGIFITPTAIPITKENTFPTTDALDSKRIEKKPNELGLSTGIGLMLANNNLNGGLLFGYDFGLTGASKQWYYNNKPWIGFGIGFKLSILGDK